MLSPFASLSPFSHPRVVAGGGAPSFDPSAYGAVEEFLWADDIAGADGDLISSWAKHTWGNDATASGGQRPTLRTGSNGIAGKKALQFNGSSNYLTIAVGPVARTVFAVIKGGTGDLQLLSCFGGNVTERIGLVYPGTAWYSGDASDIILIDRVNGSATQVHSGSSREVVSGTRGSSYGSGETIVIGAGPNTNQWYFDGLISMWLAYSDAPTRATVEAAILALY